MKAMLLERRAPIDTRPLAHTDLPEPIAGTHELRVRVEACGICRTDLHIIEGELPTVRTSVVPGHQIVGHVDALGPAATRFPLGTRVGIAWLRETCGECARCRSGRENLCERARFTGYHEHGGYAEYACVHEDFAYPIPPTLDAAAATPLLCAGIIGYRALRRAEITPGCRLGLYGFGASAHIAIQIARHMGCDVYVMTRNPRHRTLALELGAAWAGGATEMPPAPLDSAILFAPAGDLVPHALTALDRGGTLALAGIHVTDIPALVYERHLFYERQLRSVTANTRADGEELMRLATAVPLRPTTTAFALRDANRALALLKHDGLRGAGVLVP